MGGSHASGMAAETETEMEAERSARMRDARSAQKVAERNALCVMLEGTKRGGRIGGKDQRARANGGRGAGKDETLMGRRRRIVFL